MWMLALKIAIVAVAVIGALLLAKLILEVVPKLMSYMFPGTTAMLILICFVGMEYGAGFIAAGFVSVAGINAALYLTRSRGH